MDRQFNVYLVGKENANKGMGWWLSSDNLPKEIFVGGKNDGTKVKHKVQLSSSEAKTLAENLQRLAEAENEFQSLYQKFESPQPKVRNHADTDKR